MSLPKVLTPHHAASNLRLFVETCKEGAADLIKQYEEDGVVGKDPERSWQGFAMHAFGRDLPVGRHYYFDRDACEEITTYAENMTGDDWFRISRKDTYWSSMPGASFMSFALPTLGTTHDGGGPLLGVGLLNKGNAIGFLGVQTDEDGVHYIDKPMVKIAPWQDGTSWKQFVRDMGTDRDEELAHWASVALLAMEIGPKLEHDELELVVTDPAHNPFVLIPEGGYYTVGARAERKSFAWDGQWRGRLN